MSNFKIKILILIFLFMFYQYAFADDIPVASFNQLINSSPSSGDTITFIDDISSYSSIGREFFNLDLTFDGNNYSLDGNNSFSGFILNADSSFEHINIINCKGLEEPSGSVFAGAAFNYGGDMNIINSSFSNNFVNAQGFNFALGGAVYNLNDGNVGIDNVKFSNNYALGASVAGGAIANGYSTNENPIMRINYSLFENNYALGTIVPQGGAIYNRGNLSVNNSVFNSNSIISDNDSLSVLYGGAVSNTGTADISNSVFYKNSAISKNDNLDSSLGGAIYNVGTLTFNNCIFKSNYADSIYYADGGAIYNDSNSDGTTSLTIKNSTFEDNYVSNNAQYGYGGAIYNKSNLIIENSTFKNNYDKDGNLNDIYNEQTGTITFDSSGTTNIGSGIRGSGLIVKKGNSSLNLGGENSQFNGNFDFLEGNLNLLSDGSYFNAQNTNFGNNINFNMQNKVINNIDFGNLNLSGSANIFPDVNFTNNSMDTINASNISGFGNLHVKNLLIEGVPKEEFISLPFANSTLKDYVSYDATTIRTPIYNYSASYDSQNGHFNFERKGFDSSVFIPATAAQLAGYVVALETYKNIFSNLDMVMINTSNLKYSMKNKYASIQNNFTFTPDSFPEQREGLWLKPYSIFEKVPLKNGPDVSNVAYGNIIGYESGLKQFKKGIYGLYGAYASYNGSHQAFSGNDIVNNGGSIGLYGALYKNNLFSLWMVNMGANSSQASSYFANSDFAMINAGIAQKTGYNFKTFKNKLIIQPSILLSYTFVDTFSHNSANVNYNTTDLHAIQIEPGIKLIGNFKNYFQPYINVSMVWNVIDKARFRANDVYLPSLSIKPYVQYGVGIQKRYKDRLTMFIEAMIRNGGRNGVCLMAGLRWSLGKDYEPLKKAHQAKPIELKKSEIILKNISYTPYKKTL